MRDNDRLIKALVNDYEEYIEIVKSLKKEFDSTDDFERHFDMTPYPEDSSEYEDGLYQIDTVRHKPDSYPCIYVWADLDTYGLMDDFIYLRDFV